MYISDKTNSYILFYPLLDDNGKDNNETNNRTDLRIFWEMYDPCIPLVSAEVAGSILMVSRMKPAILHHVRS